MTDWKIIIIVLFGLLLITIGLFTEAGLNIGNFGRGINDALEKVFPLSFLGTSEQGNATIKGTFFVNEFDLKTLPLEEVKIGYEPEYQDTDIFVADTKLTTDIYTEIHITNYKGTFRINESKLNLVGNSEKTAINGIKFETVKKMIPVNLESVFFKNVYVDNLYMNRLEIKDVIGEIEIQDKVTLKLNYEPIKLESFSGSINITNGKFEIDGTVKKVFVSGNDYMATIN